MTPSVTTGRRTATRTAPRTGPVDEALRGVLDAVPFACAAFDRRSGALVCANARFGFDLGTLPGHAQRDALLATLHGEATGDARGDEVRAPGSGRWYALHWRDLDTNGRSLALLTAVDISERIETLDSHRSQQEKLLFTSRMMSVGEMAATLAHELNQPLAAISFYCTGCVTLLQNGNYLNSRRELLSAMQKARLQAERASRLLRRMLDLVKKHRPRPEALSLPQVLADTLALFEFDERRGAGRVCLDVAGDLPAVCADRIQLEQVLTNLIRNAFEAMAGLPVEERIVQVRAREEAEPRAGWVRIEIVDRGTGIAPEQWPLLFSSFYSTRQAGLGMGLNVWRTIVESYGSSLSVANNISGGGCTFAFSMPGAIHDGRS